MKISRLLVAVLAAVFVVLLVISLSVYTVDQTEQVIITQFGQPVGDPITEPGLHFKLPFVQTVNTLDKRFLEWDGAPVAIPTSAPRCRCHRARITATSVLASRKPCGQAGALLRLQGKVAKPSSASRIA